MFLTARLFMYQQVYLHRTVRAIDLDLAEVFGPSIRAMFGDGSPVERLAPTPTSTSTRCSTRRAGGWRVAAAGRWHRRRRGRDGWRAILLRRPRWRAEAEVRSESETGDWPRGRRWRSWATAEPGRVAIDLAVVDAQGPRRGPATTPLALEAPRRIAGSAAAVAFGEQLGLIGRRYRRDGLAVPAVSPSAAGSGAGRTGGGRGPETRR